MHHLHIILCSWYHTVLPMIVVVDHCSLWNDRSNTHVKQIKELLFSNQRGNKIAKEQLRNIFWLMQRTASVSPNVPIRYAGSTNFPQEERRQSFLQLSQMSCFLNHKYFQVFDGLVRIAKTQRGCVILRNPRPPIPNRMFHWPATQQPETVAVSKSSND